MPLLKTPAITLKSRKWGDADRLVTFYTLRFGKLRGVARGARRMKSRFGSALEPFVHCDLNLFEKRHDPVYRIMQADILEPFSGLREDLALMSSAARLVNLVAAVTAEGDAGPRIFQTLLTGLRSLLESSEPSLTTLLFQIRLLGQTGFQPQTDQCVGCGAGLRSAADAIPTMFSPQAGGVVCAPCTDRYPDRCLRLSPGSAALLQHALRWSPEILTRLKATGHVREQLGAAIEAYITVVAGKRLPPVDFLVAEPAEPAYGIKPELQTNGRDDRNPIRSEAR
jgi:DNA repair protein RecO (recombination protein O)